MKKGLLLINLGTTEQPTPKATGRYLREFLMDSFVIDLPALWRWLLVYILIVPLRKFKSSRAYAKIWFPEGSPLLVFSCKYKQAAQKLLGSEWSVQLGMRYGSPSIAQALAQFKKENITELFIFPLYPQFADSSTTTALVKVRNDLNDLQWRPSKMRSLAYFFNQSGFIATSASIIGGEIAQFSPDHIIFSYHGLPEGHLTKRPDLKDRCLVVDNCCAALSPRNELCYRAQCFSTTRLLLNQLKWPVEKSTSAFQSRLGRAQWIEPNIESQLDRLAEQGVKRILVTCPSFVSDCLETLEEVRIRMRQYFIEAGGTDLWLVPALNDNSDWIKVLPQILESDQWEVFPNCLDRLKV